MTSIDIKVTKIKNRWHARLLVDGKFVDEMACALKEDIGWICREMCRWYDKMGGTSTHAASARKRQTYGAKGRIWWLVDLEYERVKS